MNKYEFGRILESKRNELGKTIKDMAHIVGISDQQLSKYEKGNVEKPGVDVIEKLAKVCKMPFKQAFNVFYPDETENNKFDERLDNLITLIQSDKMLKGFAARHLSKYEIPAEVKVVIIRMYEKITGKKLL